MMNNIEVKCLHPLTASAVMRGATRGLIATVGRRYRVGLNASRRCSLAYLNAGKRWGDPRGEDAGILVMNLIRPHLARSEGRLRNELSAQFTKRQGEGEKKISAKFDALDRDREREERREELLLPDERLITRSAVKKIIEDRVAGEEYRLREIARVNTRPVADAALRRLKEDDEYERMRRRD